VLCLLFGRKGILNYVRFAAAGSILLLETSVLAQDNPFAAPIEDTPVASSAEDNPFLAEAAKSYADTFTSEKVKLTLSGDQTGFTGELFYQQTGQTYPVTGQVEAGVFRGTFESTGQTFSFSFELNEDDGTGKFKTAGFDDTLTSQNARQAALDTRLEGVFGAALTLVATLDAPSSTFTYTLMADILANAGHIDRLETLRVKTGNAEYINARIAQAFANEGQLEEATQILAGVSQPENLAKGLVAIAARQAEDGNTAAARATLARARSDEEKKQVLLELSSRKTLDSNVSTTRLLPLVNAIQIIETIKKRRDRDAASLWVISAYAIEDYDGAMALAGDIGFGLFRGSAYANIARMQTTAGNRAQAERAIELAESTVGRTGLNFRDSLRQSIAVAKGTFNPADGAVHQILGDLPPVGRDQGYLQLATHYFKQDDPTTGESFLRNVNNISVAYSGAAEWAIYFARIGEHERGISIAAETIETASPRAIALTGIVTETRRHAESKIG